MFAICVARFDVVTYPARLIFDALIVIDSEVWLMLLITSPLPTLVLIWLAVCSIVLKLSPTLLYTPENTFVAVCTMVE